MPRIETITIEVNVYYNCDECNGDMRICGERLTNDGLIISYRCESGHQRKDSLRYPRIETKEIPLDSPLLAMRGVRNARSF